MKIKQSGIKFIGGRGAQWAVPGIARLPGLRPAGTACRAHAGPLPAYIIKKKFK